MSYKCYQYVKQSINIYHTHPIDTRIFFKFKNINVSMEVPISILLQVNNIVILIDKIFEEK